MYLKIIYLNISLPSCPCMDGMKCSKSGFVASKKECMLSNDSTSSPNTNSLTEWGKNYLIMLEYNLDHDYMQV